MIFAGSQQVDRFAMQVGSCSDVKNKNCQGDDCCSAPARTPFLFADFVAYQAEQFGQEESKQKQT